MAISKNDYIFSITRNDYTLLAAIDNGTIHNRDYEDFQRMTGKAVQRSTSKLLDLGCITIKPCRDPGRGGKGTRIISYKLTRLGRQVLRITDEIKAIKKAQETA